VKQEHVNLLKRGVDVWNTWRDEHPEVQPNLSGTQLSKIDLDGINLRKADLAGACLSGTQLKKSDFSEANLKRADLDRTDLTGANLSGADLYKADFKRSTLVKANLSISELARTDFFRANLSGANLSGANLNRADLSETNLSQANLQGANLSRANLDRANLIAANLTNCLIYGISAWDVQLKDTKQFDLVITRPNQPTVTVDDLEIAQFIYLLLNHKKLRNVFNAVTERGVLLLGRFGDGGLEMLQAVAARLREEKYLPIIFDFERPYDHNYTETVKTLAGLSRFIVADLSRPSVPRELYATVPHFKIPFVPILEAGRKPFAMVVDLLEYPWVIRPPVIFANTDELVSLVPSKIIAPAEKKHQARQQLLNELFNNR
jgi:Uncharacterized low-complexity proteins